MARTVTIKTEDNIEGVTSKGFHFIIPKENLDDMELVDTINELDENPAKISKVAELLLGKEQKKKLYEHCRDRKTGKVKASITIETISEILTSSKEVKK